MQEIPPHPPFFFSWMQEFMRSMGRAVQHYQEDLATAEAALQAYVHLPPSLLYCHRAWG